MNVNNSSRMSFRELFSLSFIFVLMIAITGMNLVFSNTFGETCGFLHPYIFEAQVSMIDPGGGLNWNSDLTNIPSNESDVRVLDTYLRVYGEDGQLLTQDDDAIDGDRSSGSKIENFGLVQSGTIIVEMSSYGDTGSGRYEIVVSESQVAENEILRLGSSTSGNIYAGEANRLSFPIEVEAAQSVFVQVSGFGEDQLELDTYLRLYDQDKNLVNENDDFAGLGSGLVISNTGDTMASYSLELATYNDASSGHYELSVQEYALTVSEGEEISLDETVSSNIAQFQRIRHRLSLDTVLNPLISFFGQNEFGYELDAILRVYDENDELLQTYDVYGSYAISDFVLEEAGVVYLEIATRQDSGIGSYELTVSSENEAGGGLANRDAEAVTLDSQTTGTIVAGERVFHSFSVSADQPFSIFLTGTDADGATLDTILYVYDENGETLDANDDYLASGSGSGLINLSIDHDSTLSIEVSTYGDALNGSYILDVQSFQLDLVNNEPVSIGDTPEGSITVGQRLRYPIRLEAGQPLSLFLQGINADGLQLDTYLRLYDANENLLDENDDLVTALFDAGLSSGLENFTVDEATDLIIEVGAYADKGIGDFTLYLVDSLESLPQGINEIYGPDIETVVNTSLPVGRGIAGQIELNQRQQYPVSVDPNQSVILRLAGETVFDGQSFPLYSRLTIYDGDGMIADEAYSYDGSDLILVYNNTKDSPSFITVEVGTIEDYYSGAYELQILENTEANFEQIFRVQLVEGGNILLEDSPYLKGEILTGTRVRHEMELQAEQIIAVNFGGLSRLDTIARIYNENNAQLAEASSSGRTQGTLRFSAPSEGKYYIEIGTPLDGEEGEYELLVLPVLQSGNLELGANPLNGDIKPNQRNQYTLHLEAGQTVDISVRQLVPEAAGLSLFSWSGYALSSDTNAAQQWVSCLEYYGYVVDSAFRVNEYGISRFVLGTKIDDLCNPLREACQLESTVKLTELGQILLYVILPGLAIILPVITVLILQNDRIWYWVVGLIVVASFVLTSSLLYVHLGTVSGISALQDFGSGIFGGTATGAAIAFMTKVLENFSERKARQQEEAQEAIRRTMEAPVPPEIKE
jgi:hypothetical protein